MKYSFQILVCALNLVTMGGKEMKNFFYRFESNHAVGRAKKMLTGRVEFIKYESVICQKVVQRILFSRGVFEWSFYQMSISFRGLITLRTSGTAVIKLDCRKGFYWNSSRHFFLHKTFIIPANHWLRSKIFWWCKTHSFR